jgi:hypothetical protein
LASAVAVSPEASVVAGSAVGGVVGSAIGVGDAVGMAVAGRGVAVGGSPPPHAAKVSAATTSSAARIILEKRIRNRFIVPSRSKLNNSMFIDCRLAYLAFCANKLSTKREGDKYLPLFANPIVKKSTYCLTPS